MFNNNNSRICKKPIDYGNSKRSSKVSKHSRFKNLTLDNLVTEEDFKDYYFKTLCDEYVHSNVTIIIFIFYLFDFFILEYDRVIESSQT